MAKNQFRIQMRKLHKWIFIYMGAFMFFWVVSGIVISFPMSWLDVNALHDNSVVDYSTAVVSPAEAVARVRADAPADTEIVGVTTQKIQGYLLYVIKTEAGESRIIDAASGDYFEFTPEIAETIVRARYNIDTPVVENTTLVKHNFGYPWGPLPVSQLRFEGEVAGSDFYVNHESGNVRSGTLLTRARVVAGIIHTFEPVKYLTSEWTHTWVLVVTGLVSLLGVIPGLYLILPRRKKA